MSLTAEQARTLSESDLRCTHAALTALGFDPGDRVVTCAGAALERIVDQGGSYAHEPFNSEDGGRTLVAWYGKPVTLGQFMKANPTGSFYLGTADHALALVDGVLVDTAHGTGRRRLNMAYRITRQES